MCHEHRHNPPADLFPSTESCHAALMRLRARSNHTDPSPEKCNTSPSQPSSRRRAKSSATCSHMLLANPSQLQASTGSFRRRGAVSGCVCLSRTPGGDGQVALDLRKVPRVLQASAKECNPTSPPFFVLPSALVIVITRNIIVYILPQFADPVGGLFQTGFRESLRDMRFQPREIELRLLSNSRREVVDEVVLLLSSPFSMMLA